MEIVVDLNSTSLSTFFAILATLLIVGGSIWYIFFNGYGKPLVYICLAVGLIFALLYIFADSAEEKSVLEEKIEMNKSLDKFMLESIASELNVDSESIIVTNYKGDTTLKDTQKLKLVHYKNKSYVFKFENNKLIFYSEIHE